MAESKKIYKWSEGRFPCFNAVTGEEELKCTCCNERSNEWLVPYCPNCGAKMDTSGYETSSGEWYDGSEE